MSSQVAIIAGSGTFPFHVAEAAKKQGHKVLAVGLKGWVDAELAGSVDTYTELAVGQLGKLIEVLKSHQVTRAIMAGKVTKGVLFDHQAASFDAATLAILSGLKEFSVNGLLGAIAQKLAQDGIELLDSSTFLKDFLCPDAVLTARAPTSEEQVDIQIGIETARVLAQMDIGQSVAVKNRVVVAVEALEGTDEMIRRAGKLTGGGLVVVKVASPDQDRRFDLPCIGTESIKTFTESGVSCLAVQAGSTLILDPDAVVQAANDARLAIIGTSINETATID